MYPVLLELGPVKLHSYGLLIAVGFLAGLFLAQRDFKKIGLDYKTLGEMAFWGLFWGVAGTRLLYIIMFPHEFRWNDPIGWIAIWRGGLVFHGAVPASFLYVWIGLRRKRIPFWPVADIGVSYLPLGQAFGRIGCFLNGCCFGCRADDLPWAVRFPEGSPVYHAHFPIPSISSPAWSHPVHPTQVYSIIGLLSICLILVILRKKWYPFLGFVMPLYFLLYGVLRFIIEFYRADGNPTSLGFGYLSDQQMFCLFMIVAGIALHVFLWRRGEKPLDDYGQAPEAEKTRKAKSVS